MKKVIVLILVSCSFFVFVGCELDSVLSGNPTFSPPSWIIGTWSDAYDTNIYTFSGNNVIFTTSSVSINFSEAFGSSYVNLSETISDSTYRIHVSDSETSSTYRFDYDTSNTLDYYFTTSGITLGPIQLIKQ